jgi:hypothetical protein
MYHPNDPRAGLAPTENKSAKASNFAPAGYARFYAETPQHKAAHETTWLARGCNFIVAYSDVEAGAVLERPMQVDEYCLILPDKTGGVNISAGGETKQVPAFSIAFIPPGASSIEVTQAGRLIRVFSSQSLDLARACGNAADFAAPQPLIPQFQPWPAPSEWKIRSYSLDVSGQQGRFGRIFRCSTVMINFLDPRMGLRDITMLSPHHHDDFEQGSLVIDGAFVHDIRWPWVPDMRAWRDDEHELLAAPSLTVIPPPAIHTSRSVVPGFNQMIDIFAPPRADFSKKAGWVLNADDYPLPVDRA